MKQRQKPNMRFSKLKLTTISLLLAGLFLSGSFLYVSAQFSNQEDIDGVYNEKKNQIETKIQDISKNIDGIAAQYNDNKKQQTNLSAQVVNIKTEINTTNNLITDTRVVISQLDKQLQENENQKEDLNRTIKDILKQIQIKNLVSPIEIVFSGADLGAVLAQIYTLSSLQDRLTDKKEELSKINQKLQDNRKQNQQIKEQLEKTRGLLKSRQNSLDSLLLQTNSQDSKYKELLDSIAQQKKELEGQLQGISGEYLSEIKDLQDSEKQKQNYTINCKFEAGEKLEVPNGFFTRPTTGYLTQDFNCGHDGVDIANSLGTEIYSVADGEVVRVAPVSDGCVGLGCNGGFGNFVVVRHTLPSGQKVFSLYGHMQRQTGKRIGENVKKGDVIGSIGCTGYTKPYPCGVHLHFMLLSDTFEISGAGCRLGSSTCYNPLKFINPIS